MIQEHVIVLVIVNPGLTGISFPQLYWNCLQIERYRNSNHRTKAWYTKRHWKKNPPKKNKNEWKKAKVNKPKITVFPTYLFGMTDGQTKVYTSTLFAFRKNTWLSHDICSTEIMCACGVTSDLHGSVGMQICYILCLILTCFFFLSLPPALQSVTMS